jgi:hypothetical protein
MTIGVADGESRVGVVMFLDDRQRSFIVDILFEYPHDDLVVNRVIELSDVSLNIILQVGPLQDSLHLSNDRISWDSRQDSTIRQSAEHAVVHLSHQDILNRVFDIILDTSIFEGQNRYVSGFLSISQNKISVLANFILTITNRGFHDSTEFFSIIPNPVNFWFSFLESALMRVTFHSSGFHAGQDTMPS